MFSTAWTNLQEYVKTRPPMTVFVLCLTSIAVACFSFAFYIGNTDTILNRDEQLNWEYFLKHMSKRRYCIEKHTDQKSTNAVSGGNKVYIPAQLSFENGAADFSNIQGAIPINSWKPSCRTVSSQEVVTLSFTVPDITNRNKTSHDICIIFDIPSDFLIPFSATKCISDFSITGSMDALSAVELQNVTSEFCVNGKKARLYFDERRSKTFEIYLTQSEKIIIYMHLMWLSSLTLFFVIMFFCYAVLVKNNNQEFYALCIILNDLLPLSKLLSYFKFCMQQQKAQL